MIGLSADESPALGNIWRITAKKTDFYLDPLGQAGTTFHLSVHGPNNSFGGHRFHIRVDHHTVNGAKEQGYFVEHSVPRKGFAFDGQQVAARAFLVARIRWTWHLQRPRFRAAVVSGAAPELADHQMGARLSEFLPPNHAWDIDIVVSYNEPYWPHPLGSLRDNARLGPLRNKAGLWLTATSYRRFQKNYPTPEELCLRLPGADEEPNRITCGGPGPDGANGMYWFVETITSRELIEASGTKPEGVAG